MLKNIRITRHIMLVVSSLLIAGASFGQCGQLVWSDEFDETSLDLTKWNYDLGNGCPNCGWGNSELQNYTNSNNNIRINGGKLEIEAVVSNNNYTSARITTQGVHSWKYGRFEMRAKMPSGTGVWPAFWMLPVNGNWPTTGEIDIMELRGDRPEEIGGTLHYGSSFPANQNDGTSFVLDDSEGTFADDFHVFAVEWEEGEIRWYLDDELYKTETENPKTLNPGSSSTAWPWDDQEFYIIINLAVGGSNTPYTGFQDPSFGTSALMEVDYVRVFDAAQPTANIDGPVKVFDQSISTYSVENNTNESYLWTVPSDATITNGQGTNSITVDWGFSEGGDVTLSLEHISGACVGGTFFYTHPVEVFTNSCEFDFENFDDQAAMTPGYRDGDLSDINNPGSNAINSSSLVGEYKRNGGSQFDVLIYEGAILDPALEYVGGEKVFKVDVRTDAVVGTSIELQVGNSDFSGDFPNGVHSTYTAVTTVRNQWETLTFSYSQSPDPNGASYENNLDRMIFLFAPNTFTSNTFYFDNVRRDLSPSTSTITLTGTQVIEENEIDVVFTATGGDSNSMYDWTLPVGATITTGAGTSSIVADFALSGGIISVTERVESGCTGEPALLQVSVGGNSCALFADEFDDANTSSWITVNGEAGFVSSEAGSDWTISSTGHDEWANITYDINNGTNAVSLDFTQVGNNPLMHIRAKASSPVLLTATLLDANGIAAANQFLSPLNNLELTTEYQEFTIDFNGQLWDEFNGGGELNTSDIEKVRLAINGGYASFPVAGFGNSFVGDIQIDYIRIGDECETSTANFIANKTNLCGTGEEVIFTDQSITSDPNTTYDWDFGEGASENGAATKGPHTISYNTSGWKTVSLSINDGESMKTRTNYIFVGSNVGECASQMNFNSEEELDFVGGAGSFSFSQAASDLTIATDGHDEWDSMLLNINNGIESTPLNFGCSGGLSPVIKVRARASSNAALSLSFTDVNGVTAGGDNLNILNPLELTTEYQTFEIDLTGLFFDQFASGGALDVDSSQIESVFMRMNPGFASFPITGVNDVYDAAFNGTVDIDEISIGGTCVLTGLNNRSLNSTAVKIYPNPFNTELNISDIDKLNILEVELLNAQGQLLTTSSIVNGKVFVDESLPSGLYLVRLITDSDSYVTSVVKE